ncbi:hypothetical protein DFH06DRAFT_1196060 [Mycena polygramma]|nr:hypothetical protein DFH06DRAFT_1196060 [Mycena polygramma]
MLPALRQLLPRPSYRYFGSCAAISNAFPSAYAVRPRYPRPTAYNNITIDPDSNFPSPQPNADGTPEEQWRTKSRNMLLQLQNQPIADAYSVKEGQFADAVRKFETILSKNQVKRTIRLTERHEKKGPKRRRIKSQQWRKHFANQVRKDVQLVHKIRRRGV